MSGGPQAMASDVSVASSILAQRRWEQPGRAREVISTPGCPRAEVSPFETWTLPFPSHLVSVPHAMANSRFEYVRTFELPDPLLPATYLVVRVDGKGFHRCVPRPPPRLTSADPPRQVLRRPRLCQAE